LFNVVYEDNSVPSNCRVPNEVLGGLRGDEPARGFIMEQDREIAQKGGRPAVSIKHIERFGAKKKWTRRRIARPPFPAPGTLRGHVRELATKSPAGGGPRCSSAIED
jgi:hypothetical protein